MARLRLSNDIEFEEETFISMMNEAKEVSSQIYAFCGLLTLVNVSMDEVYWYEFYTNLQSNAIKRIRKWFKNLDLLKNRRSDRSMLMTTRKI